MRHTDHCGSALWPMKHARTGRTMVGMDEKLAIHARTDRGTLCRLLPRWTWSVHAPLLLVAGVAGLGVAALTALAISDTILRADVSTERTIQSITWGPLPLAFPFFSWIGDAKGALLEAGAFALVLLLNRRAWLLAIAGALTGAWYVVISHLVLRPRPTVQQVLQVTEHPGASSFPSGHTIFVATVSSLLMLCLGYRYLPGWARPLGWLGVAAAVFAAGISRIYVGAHWPSDVLAGLLIVAAWLSLVVSVRWISDPALAR
jgi:membrane-associated phospholipid phosphatase